VTNLVIVDDQDMETVHMNVWPQDAQDIMNGAGMEAAWADVKTLQCACSLYGTTGIIFPHNKGKTSLFSLNSGKRKMYNIKGQALPGKTLFNVDQPVFRIIIPEAGPGGIRK